MAAFFYKINSFNINLNLVEIHLYNHYYLSSILCVFRSDDSVGYVYLLDLYR